MKEIKEKITLKKGRYGKEEFYFAENDEYIEDNMIYCSKCKTPILWISPDKQEIDGIMVASMFGKCQCKCREEDYNVRQEQERLEKKKIYIQSLKENSLLGKKYANVNFDNFIPNENLSESFKAAYNKLLEYFNDWQRNKNNGNSAFMFGETGVGKTTLEAVLSNSLIEKYHVAVVFTNFSEIVNKIKDTFKQNSRRSESDVLDFYNSVELLVIDDIGIQKFVNNDDKDNYLQAKVYDIINNRTSNYMPMIFTSNYSLQNLIEERGLNKAIASRIYDVCKENYIEIKGKNYRLSSNEFSDLF